MENQVGWHGKAPNQAEYEQAMAETDRTAARTGGLRHGRRNKKKATRESYGEALRDFAETYENLVVLDADLAAATKTGIFKKAYPERFFDCGIAEAEYDGR